MSRITTPFDFHSTAADVLAGVDLAGKRAIVTGASSGIGIETARALADAGAELTLAVRDPRAGKRAAADIVASTASTRVHVTYLDLADRRSIAGFADDWVGPLDILVNNAGVLGLPLTRTPKGWEMHFAVNHMGHFDLTMRLLPALRSAEAGARVVAVSSSAHQTSPIVFDDIHYERRAYDAVEAYGQSKTANALFAIEAARRWADAGIRVNAAMPGAIATGLQRHREGKMWTPPEGRKSAEQGAATSVLLAASPLVADVTGRYFADCNESASLPPGGAADLTSVAPHALDPATAGRLWDVCEQMLKIAG